MCNGYNKCPDKSDERNCEKWVCSSSYFKCTSNTKCVPWNRIGNGKMDCPDGSDELYYPNGEA